MFIIKRKQDIPIQNQGNYIFPRWQLWLLFQSTQLCNKLVLWLPNVVSVPLFIKGLTILRWARGVIELRCGKVFNQWKEGTVGAVSKVILRKWGLKGNWATFQCNWFSIRFKGHTQKMRIERLAGYTFWSAFLSVSKVILRKWGLKVTIPSKSTLMFSRFQRSYSENEDWKMYT